MKTEVKNNSNVAQYVATPAGARLLQPGESLMVEVQDAETQTTDLPTRRMVEVGAGGPDSTGVNAEKLKELQALKVEEIKAVLGEMDSPSLTYLLELEQKDEKPRVTLISEIEASLLAIKAKT